MIRIVRHFNVPARRVFDAWSDPATLPKWAWAGLGHDPAAEVDLRVGGQYRVTTRQDDGTVAFHGEYLEIEPGSRLVFTLHWDAPMGYDVKNEQVTVEVRDTDRGSEMTFTHEGVESEEARETHEQGWSAAFDLLERTL